MQPLIPLILLITLTATPAQAGLLGELGRGVKAVKNLFKAEKTPPVKIEPKTLHARQQLKHNMGNICKPNWQAHHIIPVELITHAALSKCGYDINQANNGICLPASDGGTLPKHQGYHSAYNQAVTDAIDSIPANLGTAQTCAAIARIQSCLIQGIAEGLPLYGETVKTAWQHCR